VTAETWLSGRSPGAPADLAAAVFSAVQATRSSSAPVGLQITSAVAELLPRVVASGCDERRGAFDLLTLDALITYAMEAASSSAEDSESTAAAVLRELGQAASSLSQAPKQ
jgi:hypothetical protein